MATKKTTALANYDAELAALAAANATAEENTGSGGTFLSTRNGVLSFRGNDILNNQIDVVVLDYIFENHYYTGRFDPNSPQTPTCFAFATVAEGEKSLAPHEKAIQPQAEQCAGCRWNEFGTAETGKGKACKNIRRLAMVPAGALDDGELDTTEIVFLKLPVTSVRNWAAYVKELNASLGVPPLAVVTRIGVTKDSETQFKVSFSRVEDVDKKLLPALLKRRMAALDALQTPYLPIEEDARPAKPAARRSAPAAKPAANARRKF
jgi:hypothetical protein